MEHATHDSPSSDPSNEQQAPCSGCPCPKRRLFMRTMVGAFAALWGTLTLFPFLSYLASAGQQETEEEVTSVSVGNADAFPKNSGKNFKFGSKPALVYRDAAGDFYAYSAICTHLGCTVQYKADKDSIWCACHGGKYDAKTGKNIAGPPPKPLPALPVAVNNGEIIVTKA